MNIWDYITSDNSQAAVRMDELFSDAAARLVKYLKVGRLGNIPGTHELIPHEGYRLVDEIEEEIVWILALVHTAKQWPPLQE